MKKLFSAYFGTTIIVRLFLAFVLGSLIGFVVWFASSRAGVDAGPVLNTWVAPWGSLFVKMLKMVVIPVVFFSLVMGAATLPIKRFGKVGLRIIILYFVTSVFAALVGIAIALVFNPGKGGMAEWNSLVQGGNTAEIVERAVTSNSFSQLLLSAFENPFASLSSGNFLAIIVFAIMFGLAVSILRHDDEERYSSLLALVEAVNKAMHKIVSWIMEYAPVGVFALSIVNFGIYGPQIVGPYIKVVSGVIVGVFVMIFIVYSLLLKVMTGTGPATFFRAVKEAMLTAFVTRSSAATLPVTMGEVEDNLGVKSEISSFSLPLGATINMDGVCVHLPMFAVLTANIFGLELTASSLFVLVITTVLAAVGAGGVPGGSLMLLFIILNTMGISPEQTAVIVTIALGVNPILDMFETMNNVTGDMTCTYIIAHREGMIEKREESVAE